MCSLYTTKAFEIQQQDILTPLCMDLTIEWCNSTKSPNPMEKSGYAWTQQG